MEFTTKITEQDFLDAYRLRCNSLVFIQRIATFILYLLTAFCGTLIVYAIIRVSPRPEDREVVNSLFVILLDVLPLEILTFVYVLFLKLYTPYRVRRLYRKDPSQHGENVVQLGPEGLSEKSSIGSNVHFPWAACAQWRESRRVVVLMLQSGLYFIFPKACLSAEQIGELRSILAASLPRK
jgi:hypothetical protein